MNMIFNGPGISANGTQDIDKVSADNTALGKMITAWETKQKAAKKLGGFGLLAVTLAACNSDDDDSAASVLDVTPYDDAYVATQVAAATAAAETAAADAAAAAKVVTDAAAATAATDAAAAVTTQTAYDALTAPKTLAFTAATTADALVGGQGDDTVTAATGTINLATDSIRDNSALDNDTLTVTDATGSLPAFVTQGIENVNLNISSLTSAAVSTLSYSGVTNLTITKGDVTLGGSVLTGAKTVTLTDVGTGVAKVTLGTGATGAASITQTVTAAGTVIDANTTTGTVSVFGAATIDAANSTSIIAGGTANAVQDAKPMTITAAKATDINVGSASVAGVFDDNAITGLVTITGAAADNVDAKVAGGAIVSVLGGNATAGQGGVSLTLIDASGATVTTTMTGTTASPQIIDLGSVATAGVTSTSTVTAVGVVSLDGGASAGPVDQLTLNSNGAAVTYNLVMGNGVVTSIAVGNDVTLGAAEAVIDGKAITGTAKAINLASTSTASTINASLWNADSIGIAFDNTNSAITAAAGQTYTFTSNTQTTGLNFDFLATTTVQDLNLVSGDVNGTSSTVGTLSVGTLDLVSGATTNSGTVNITANDSNLTATSTVGYALTNIIVTGDEDVTFGTVATVNSINSQGSTGKTSATLGVNAKAISTGTGVDTIVLNGNRIHTVDAGAGNDIITVTDTAATSTIDGGAGNDAFTLTEAATQYVVIGGTGNDTFSTAVTVISTIVGGEGTDTLTITAGGQTYSTTGFAVTGVESLNLTGTNGTTIFGAAQFAGLSTSAITATGGNDILQINAAATLGSTLDNSGLTVATLSDPTINYVLNNGADTITGGVYAENFVMNAAQNGLLGADTIEGGGTGIDTISSDDTTITPALAGSGATTGIVLNMGTTAVSGVDILSNVGDFLSGSASSVAAGTMAYIYNLVDAATPVNSSVVKNVSGIENFTSTDAAGVEYIVGSSAANTILAGAGNDYISGGPGADNISGEAGADTILGGDAADTLTGGDGIDTITTGNGIDKVSYFGIVAAANANNVTDFTYGLNGDVMQFSDASLTVDAGAFTAGTAIATTTVALVAGGRDVANEIIVDTIANLGALGATIADESGNGNNVYQLAISSDTGAIFYDANGDWSAGSVQIGDLNNNAATALVAGNFEIIA